MAREPKRYQQDVPDSIPFFIGDDEFHAVAICPGGLVQDLIRVVDLAKNSDKMDGVFGFLDDILLPESAERFAHGMRSTDKPIGFKTALEVFEDLLEEYTGGEDSDLPTQGDSASSAGSPETGPSSTAPAPSKGTTRRAAVSLA